MKKLLSIVGVGVVGAIGFVVVVGVMIAMIIFSMVAGIGGATSGALKQTADNNSNQCTPGDGGGNYVPTTMTQVGYLRTMIGVAKGLHVSEQGQVVAAMVMLQESGLHNYANDGANKYGYSGFPVPGAAFWLKTAKLSLSMKHDSGFVSHDADSVGLYAQRASAGWASDETFQARDHPKQAIERLLSPVWTSAQFFGGAGGSPSRGLRDVANWEKMSPTAAAQAVQGSAAPTAYARWQAQATSMVSKNQDAPKIDPYSPNPGASESSWSEPSIPYGTTHPTSSEARSTVNVLDSGSGNARAVAAQLPMKPKPDPNKIVYPMHKGTYTLTSGFGPRPSPGGIGSTYHLGQDFGAALGTPIYAAASGTVVRAGPTPGFGHWIVIDTTVGGKKYSNVYGHMFANGIKVKVGQKVTAGQQIAVVGQDGDSTGPHLHFEVWPGGRWGGKAVDPMPFLNGDLGQGDPPSGVSTDDCSANGDPGAATGTAKSVIAYGEKWLGTPYSWGGGSLTGPTFGILSGGIDGRNVKGFDCSGYVRYMVWNGGHLLLPRTASEQYQATKANTVSKSELEPGDLMFWGTASFQHHVAIYVGGGKVIEENHPGGSAGIRPVSFIGTDFFAATRLSFKDKAPAAAAAYHSTTPNGRYIVVAAGPYISDRALRASNRG